MKASVLVYGMYTCFDIAVKSWRFLNEIDCDVYFSTWSHHKKYSPKLDYLSEFDVNEDMIRKHIPNLNLQIHNEKDYIFDYTLLKVIFHWNNCLKMIEESGKKYDIMILTRPENFMKYIFDSSEFFNKNEKNKIYGLENIKIVGNNKYFIQDIFFVGDFNIMYDLLNTMPTDSSDMHGKLSEHIISKNLQVEVINNIGVMTLRPNCVESNENNYEKLWDKVQEWG